MIDHGDETETVQLTMSEGLIACLEDAADRAGLSLDDYCCAALTSMMIIAGELKLVGERTYEQTSRARA